MKFTPKQFNELKISYDKGLNLTELVSMWGYPIDFETISIIYELQAGTYTKHAIQNTEYIDIFTSEIVSVLGQYLNNNMSILDCGTGEGTTLIPILKKLKIPSGYAIDASISRVLWAQQNATKAKIDLNLAVSDLGQLPLGNNSVDAVITVHALEPNGGREIELIQELGRVARKYVFLIEPDFENASAEQKIRMKKLSYITGLDAAIKENGFKILVKIPIKNNSNELNAASITVVQTNEVNQQNSDLTWTDPIYKSKLNPYLNGLRSFNGLWYPTVSNIPLLRKADTQYLLSPPHDIKSMKDLKSSSCSI
jgi:ubiquinone/menaquinone biosynthesis C-methylase UbiE